jgi:N-methylhydantoinase A
VSAAEHSNHTPPAAAADPAAADPAAVSVGVDVGGTFTDLVAVHRGGPVQVAKVLSTPADRSQGVMDAVRHAALDPAAVARFVHGTTVVTNLLLERAGTRVVLLATAGFTDLLWLRRQERASLYDLTRQQPAPLIAHDDVIPVRERVAPEWELAEQPKPGDAAALPREAPLRVVPIEPLTSDEIAAVVEQAKATGAEAFAIVLLHGPAYPTHEQALHDALRTACPEATIAVSHDVLPEIREYERTATTVAEAYARPAVHQYLQSLTAALQNDGLPSPRVMTSAGGTLAASEAETRAASLALSGPAGGVTAAAVLCRDRGIANALTIDIGGTSADVGLIVDGAPLVERGGELDGIPIALPRVLVETVAAGGGSIGRVDAGNALQVGPESAGADPGPACYGRGGTRATITDAHVALGHIAEGEWGGAVRIDAALARNAVAALAQPLARTVEDTAQALVSTANATMARALRRVSVERGQDPRDLVLVAFGGGGPLHACGLADLLGMTRVFVPPFAGVLSALGLALAAERRDDLANVMRRTDTLDAGALQAVRAGLVERLGGEAARRQELAWARMRYVGQGHELDVPLPSNDPPAELAARFGDLHAARFGYTLEQPTEIVSVRVALEGEAWPMAGVRSGANPATEVVDGPCTVTLADATLRVEAGWRATPLDTGGWWLDRESV